MARKKDDYAALDHALRAHALSLPEAYEETPWGHAAIKVKGKTFLFAGSDGEHLSISTKLPTSGRAALALPFCEPTHYGLGKSGWVTASFKGGARPPAGLLERYIEESYRAVAPKKLVAQLDAGAAPPRRPAAAKKKLRARVGILSRDPKRAARSEEALTAAGVSPITCFDAPDAARARLARLDALVIDLGRLPEEGLTLAAEIDASDHPIHLFVVGVRDADAERRVRAKLDAATLSRRPPGDPSVVAAVVDELTRYAQRR